MNFMIHHKNKLNQCTECFYTIMSSYHEKQHLNVSVIVLDNITKTSILTLPSLHYNEDTLKTILSLRFNVLHLHTDRENRTIIKIILLPALHSWCYSGHL